MEKDNMSIPFKEEFDKNDTEKYIKSYMFIKGYAVAKKLPQTPGSHQSPPAFPLYHRNADQTISVPGRLDLSALVHPPPIFQPDPSRPKIPVP